MIVDNDIQNNPTKYEKFKGGEPERVMLYHELKLENLRIISDKTNYLEMDTAKIPVVNFVCDIYNLPMENQHHPSKVDSVCINCNKTYP